MTVAHQTFTFDGASTLSDLSKLKDALLDGPGEMPALELSDAVPQVVVFALAQLLIAAERSGVCPQDEIRAVSDKAPQLGAMFALTGMTGAAHPAAA